jgi:hypothetical protein
MKKSKQDLRSPLAKERDAWLESKEGRGCLAGTPTGQYLQNRLERAFMAGVRAAEKLTGQTTSQ